MLEILRDFGMIQENIAPGVVGFSSPSTVYKGFKIEKCGYYWLVYDGMRALWEAQTVEACKRWIDARA